MSSSSAAGSRSMLLHPDIAQAYGVLDGKPLLRELSLRLACLQGPDILDLASLANKVREKFSPGRHACTIMNVKSGACPEDCRFCSQSGRHHAAVDVFPLRTAEAMLEAAHRAYGQGVRTFGIVTSGTGYLEIDAEFQAILDSLRRLREALPDMEICGAFGTLSEATARALAAAGLKRYNINLQTSPDRYRELIATTHTVGDKFETVRLLHRFGVECCTGGIFGLGETAEDRVQLAWAVRDLEVECIPLNVLLPMAGTPAETQPPVPVAEIAKAFALFRLINPAAVIKFAAGRETRMKDFQGLLMLAGANGLLTGGYLTTRGRETAEDIGLMSALDSFHVQ